METRICGAVHPLGAVCNRVIFTEPGCCTDRIYQHKGPHQHTRDDGTITNRWKAKIVVEDCEFDAFAPLPEEE